MFKNQDWDKYINILFYWILNLKIVLLTPELNDCFIDSIIGILFLLFIPFVNHLCECQNFISTKYHSTLDPVTSFDSKWLKPSSLNTLLRGIDYKGNRQSFLRKKKHFERYASAWVSLIYFCKSFYTYDFLPVPGASNLTWMTKSWFNPLSNPKSARRKDEKN